MIRSNMADAELIAAAADIGESNWSLNHGPGTEASDYPAVNAMVIPIGRRINEIESEEVRKLSIPICQECVEGLQSDAWVLVYCLNCGGKFGDIWFDTPNSFANAPSEDM